MTLNKYNNLLTSGRWYTKDPKDAQILSQVGLTHNLMESKNTSENISEKSTKG